MQSLRVLKDLVAHSLVLVHGYSVNFCPVMHAVQKGVQYLYL